MTDQIRQFNCSRDGELYTNIKGLPEGEYVSGHLHSDMNAYRVERKTKTTMTVRRVEVARDPEWKPEMHAGGFAAHCSNNAEQTWLFDGFADTTLTIRLRKSRYAGSEKLYAGGGREFLINGARHFHDYNF